MESTETNGGKYIRYMCEQKCTSFLVAMFFPIHKHSIFLGQPLFFMVSIYSFVELDFIQNTKSWIGLHNDRVVYIHDRSNSNKSSISNNSNKTFTNTVAVVSQLVGILPSTMDSIASLR